MRLMSVQLSIGVALIAAILTGCGSGAAPGNSTVPSQSAPKTTTSSPSSPRINPSSAGDVTLTGTVNGDGLTCVRFVSDDGHQYVISGAVPGAVAKVARSGDKLNGPTVKLTIVGHTDSSLMNTCGGTTFVVSSSTIHSIG